ncbi:MAG: hypothetical protein ABW135_08395 [Thermoleophilaceae bacterium]
MADHERKSARQRLEFAMIERDRLGKSFDAAIGTPSELRAYVRLGAAVEEVASREAWFEWVDDESYRGLNAGPFELLAESRASRLH